MSSSSVICTMFEKRYALGVGALTNSLVAAGFTGTFVIGYRGALPAWLTQCREEVAGERWRVGEMTLRFLRLDTADHFTNHKPQFLLRLLDQEYPQAERVAYIDPDIVLKCRWNYIEEWSGDAVALCADVNAQCPPGHPLRRQWERYFAPHGLVFRHQAGIYVNAGFICVPRSQRMLLEEWRRAQDLMAPAIGGLGTAFPKDRTFLFHMTDQDALNAVLDCTAAQVALIGQDGMDFIPGGYVMSHAQGRPKPWDKRFVREALRGFPATTPDKHYWRYVKAPLEIHSSFERLRARIGLTLSSAIGRLYRRGG
jgi:hypothetical protein